VPGVRPVTDALMAVVYAFITEYGVPLIAVIVSKVGLVEYSKLFRLLPPPALMEDDNLTVLSVTELCALEKMIGIIESTLPITAVPKVLPDALVASNRK